MGNKFYGEGNLGKDPRIHRLEDSDNDEKAVCNLSVYFDYPVPKKGGGFDDKGGFWMEVEIWGKRAVACNETFSKGDRVLVQGSIIGKPWRDDNDMDRVNLAVRAKRISPDLSLVHSRAEQD